MNIIYTIQFSPTSSHFSVIPMQLPLTCKSHNPASTYNSFVLQLSLTKAIYVTVGLDYLLEPGKLSSSHESN